MALLQVGTLEFALQVFRLVADDEIGAAGNAELDADHRRDGVGGIRRALVDAHAAGGETIVDLLEIVDVLADLHLGPIRAGDVVERDLDDGRLDGGRLHVDLR